MSEEQRKLVGAALIVKNEANALRRTLESLASWCDVLVVLDTGSTDGTQELIRNTWKGPLRLTEETWDGPFDYAKARNRALELAGTEVEFTLSLSADERLIGGKEMREFLEAQRDTQGAAFCVMMQLGPRRWPFPRILRSSGGWRYQNTAGLRHEAPFGPKGEKDAPLAPGVFIVHQEAASGLERKLKRLREVDLPELTRIVEDESIPIEDRAESMFQLAETHYILGYNEPNDEGGQPKIGGRWLSHYFSSMALYSRYAEIANHEESRVHDETRAVYAQTMYLSVAEVFGLFEPTELVKRAAALAARDTRVPEIHWLLAKNAARVDVRKAIPLAMKAAKIAWGVYRKPGYGAVDTTLQWQSLRLASACAQKIKDKRLQADFAKQALAAGAPPQFMEGLLES